MNALRATSVSALLVLALLGTTMVFAGTATDPEITDAQGDEAIVGEAPDVACAGEPANACLGSIVDVHEGWVTETEDSLVFRINVASTTAGGKVYGPSDLHFNFTILGAQYNAGADVSWGGVNDVPTDGSASPAGDTSSVASEDGGVFALTVLRADIGMPPMGASLTELYIEANLYVAGLPASTVSDRAPDENFGRDYELSMGPAPAGGGPDSDGDGLNDTWEIDNFGDLSQNGTDDPDDDGLTNAAEQHAGTDPNDPDTDGDGFNDDVEVNAGSNPNDANSIPGDEDADGLPDAWEIDQFGNITAQNGTGDPDGDGLNNTGELNAGTNATNPDTDGDSYTDGNETAEGTDPLDPLSYPGSDVIQPPTDEDGDGLDDDWETTHFTNTTAQNGTGDPDDDGLDNEAEETAGTDPNDADSDSDGFDDKAEVGAGSDPNDATSTPDTITVSQDDDDLVQKLKDDWVYAAIAGGLMLLVVLLGIIALAGRWA